MAVKYSVCAKQNCTCKENPPYPKKKELAVCLVAAELGHFLHEELKISKD